MNSNSDRLITHYEWCMKQLNLKIERLQLQKFTSYDLESEHAIWIWMDDEPNFPRSMSDDMPIIISKEDLFRIAKHGFNKIESTNEEDHE